MNVLVNVVSNRQYCQKHLSRGRARHFHSFIHSFIYLLNKTIVKSAVKRTIEQDSKDKAPNFYNSRPVAIRAGNHYILRWAYTVQHYL